MKILIVSDAWHPQVNGVVRTYDSIMPILEQEHEVKTLDPSKFKTIPCPSYPEIRLALFPRSLIKKSIQKFEPDCIHVCTEGTLGITAIFYCQQYGIPFTSSFHSKWPEYVQQRWGIPTDFSYTILQSLHKNAVKTLVPAQGIADELTAKGFKDLVTWTRGIDRNIFYPDPAKERHSFLHRKQKTILYVGRLAPEKNLEAFCTLSENPNYHCIAVGDGPERKRLHRKYKHVKWVGYKRREDLSQYYNSANVMVFPSRTDTFGISIIESIACGTPVAAYPVTGPRDIIIQGKSGFMDEDLSKAVEMCLKLPTQDLPQYVDHYTWQNCAKIFVENLESIDWSQTKLKTNASSS